MTEARRRAGTTLMRCDDRPSSGGGGYADGWARTTEAGGTCQGSKHWAMGKDTFGACRGRKGEVGRIERQKRGG